MCIALGLDYKTVKRVTFQEITEQAVKAAVTSPRTIDIKLVAAQESRRAIDRLVGYEVSPVLWKKLESGLSAGRVQSVALRMAVERERVILGFADKYNFQVLGYFKTVKGDLLRAKRKDAFITERDAGVYLQSSLRKTFTVFDVTTNPIEKVPLPPYSTSSLQQDGVKKLKMNVKKVMDVAQKLFEGGHITYMRTDSLNLSDTAIAEAKSQISAKYGHTYFEERKFKSKAGSQEAHEAIRPTHWENLNAGETTDEQQLYDLIYRRALASQMKPARYDETIITLVSNIPQDFYSTTARILTFDGYLRVYQEEAEEENGTIQPVSIGETLTMLKLEAKQVFAKLPKRLNEATLVAELEKKQIGRPSTYASILNTILQREYIKPGDAPGRKIQAASLVLENGNIIRSEKSETLGSDKNKLIPTEKGTRLTAFMEANLSTIVDYQFTVKCEEHFDEIAEGKNSFNRIVPSFDQQLMQWLAVVDANYADVEKEGAIEVGMFEGSLITAGKGKFGSYIKYANIHYSLGSRKPNEVSLQEAIDLIELKRANKPIEIGSFEGKPLKVGKGQYGTYVQMDGKYYQIDGKEPGSVNLAHAIEVIGQKRTQLKEQAEQKSQNLIIKLGKKLGKYEVISGKFGLYVTDGQTNASIPKNCTQEEVLKWTVKECKECISAYLKWKKSNKK